MKTSILILTIIPLGFMCCTSQSTEKTLEKDSITVSMDVTYQPELHIPLEIIKQNEQTKSYGGKVVYLTVKNNIGEDLNSIDATIVWYDKNDNVIGKGNGVETTIKTGEERVIEINCLEDTEKAVKYKIDNLVYVTEREWASLCK